MQLQGGRIHVSSLEVFASDNCNLRCRHCSANSPYAIAANQPDLEQLRADLSTLEPIFHSRQIKVLGGEPLLNSDLNSLLRIARESRVFDWIKVATNGLLLPKMNDEFWELVDIVDVSVYPSTKPRIQKLLPSLAAKAKISHTVLEVNTKDVFERVFTDTPITDRELVHHIFNSCREAHEWSCHLLYRGRIYRCSRVHGLDQYLTQVGVQHLGFTEVDGLEIASRPSLLDELYDYLTSETPLHACEFCLGTSGVPEAHGQLSSHEIKSKRAGRTELFSPFWIVS